MLQDSTNLFTKKIFYRLFADVCSLGCAMSIKWMVKSVQNTTNSTSSSNDDNIQIQNVTVEDLILSPYIIMFGILMLGMLQGLFSQSTSHISVLAGIRAKNALLLALFEKILRTPLRKLDHIIDEGRRLYFSKCYRTALKYKKKSIG